MAEHFLVLYSEILQAEKHTTYAAQPCWNSLAIRTRIGTVLVALIKTIPPLPQKTQMDKNHNLTTLQKSFFYFYFSFCATLPETVVKVTKNLQWKSNQGRESSRLLAKSHTKLLMELPQVNFALIYRSNTLSLFGLCSI